MKLASYPAYRTSQIEWVQTVPVDWEECSAKINFLMQLGKMLQNDPSGLEDVEISYLKALHVNWTRVTKEDLPTMWASPSDLEQYSVSNGDLLVCEGGEVGRAAIIKGLEEPAIIQNALHRVRDTERGDVRYFAYLLKHIADAGWFAILCNKATIAHLTGDKLGAIYMPAPTVSEQQQIAAFLDWKTGQIDALIGKKQELLEKLKEKRLAVITQAVTKGLNPAAPLRDSGVPWLGQVPKHWILKRLRYCTDLVTSGSRGWAQHFSDFGELFLRITNLDRESIELLLDDIQRVEPPDGAEGARTLTKPGDLLVSITADLGSVAVIPLALEPAYVSQHLSLIRLDTAAIDPNWIAYSIFSHAGKFQLRMAGYGGTKVQLSLGDIKEIGFCHPPTLEEQQEILDFIWAQTKRCEYLIDLATQAIARLTEYRTALITAAVTGKIDVRRVKIPEKYHAEPGIALNGMAA